MKCSSADHSGLSRYTVPPRSSRASISVANQVVLPVPDAPNNPVILPPTQNGAPPRSRNVRSGNGYGYRPSPVCTALTTRSLASSAVRIGGRASPAAGGSSAGTGNVLGGAGPFARG